jgi:hypothetical protein
MKSTSYMYLYTIYSQHHSIPKTWVQLKCHILNDMCGSKLLNLPFWINDLHAPYVYSQEIQMN